MAGRVDDEEKWRLLGEADLLCAPSLGGESFGMVLTEAFASGTPVVASDIAGYRDVSRDGVDGVLVPVGRRRGARRGAARRWRSTPAPRARMAAAARERAERFAWPRVAGEVIEVYEEALASRAARGPWRASRSARAASPADRPPRVRPQRCPRSSRKTRPPGRRAVARGARRVVVAAGARRASGWPSGAPAARHRVDRARSWPRPRSGCSSAFALMCASMLLRAEAWHAILRAALPGTRVRRRDAAAAR